MRRLAWCGLFPRRRGPGICGPGGLGRTTTLRGAWLLIAWRSIGPGPGIARVVFAACLPFGCSLLRACIARSSAPPFILLPALNLRIGRPSGCLLGFGRTGFGTAGNFPALLPCLGDFPVGFTYLAAGGRNAGSSAFTSGADAFLRDYFPSAGIVASGLRFEAFGERSLLAVGCSASDGAACAATVSVMDRPAAVETIVIVVISVRIAAKHPAVVETGVIPGAVGRPVRNAPVSPVPPVSMVMERGGHHRPVAIMP